MTIKFSRGRQRSDNEGRIKTLTDMSAQCTVLSRRISASFLYTVIPQYPRGIGSRSPPCLGTKIYRHSSPLCEWHSIHRTLTDTLDHL
jgi:hypothetical protein